MLTRGDNVVGGKLASSRCVHRSCPERIEKRATLGQSWRQGKGTGRRQTNYAGIVKVTRIKNWMSGDCERRPAARLGKPEISGEEMGKSTRRAHRCKSRRHVHKGHFLRNWRDLDMFRKGKREYKVAYPLKSLSKRIKESEMTIVAITLEVSKAFRSEGSLAFSVYSGGGSA